MNTERIKETREERRRKYASKVMFETVFFFFVFFAINLEVMKLLDPLSVFYAISMDHILQEV